MSTKTAAIGEALSQAHAALWKEYLEETEQWLDSGATDELETLRARLRAARRHLIEHFRIEQQGGYMDEVRQQEPRLEHAVQRLAQEHRELAQELEALLAAANAANGMDHALREKVRHWLLGVRQHDTHENDLAQEGLIADTVAED